MRKSLWIVLACVCSLGIGLAAWQASSAHFEAVESSESAESPKTTAEPNGGRVDCFSDPLPPGALARLGTVRLRHIGKTLLNPGGANSVVFSRDGKVLITAGWDNPIRLWDAATGKLLRSFSDNRKNRPLSIVLSPDGRTLATGNDNSSVCLWEVTTGKLLRQLKTVASTFTHALAFSRDGRTLLSAGQNNHLRVWEVATAKEVRDQTLENAEKAGRDSRFQLSVFSPDGKILASIYTNTPNDTNVVYFWETATGKELGHLTLGEKGRIPPGAVAFSPNSRFLALAVPPDINVEIPDISDRAVHLLEVATGKEVRRWALDDKDKMGTYSLAFSPDGKVLATGSGFGPIRFWEAASGKELRRCQGYRAHVVALAFSPDGSTLAYLAGIHDSTAQLWEVASGKERVPLSRGHVGPVLSVAFSPDGKSLISGGRDGLAGLWNAETGQEQGPPLRGGDFEALAAPSADGKTFLTVGNSFSPKGQNLREIVFQTPTQVCVWDRATGQRLRQFHGPSAGFPLSLALSPDGKILVLTFPRSVHLIEVATGKEIRSYDGLRQRPVLSPDGKTLAMARNKEERKGTVQFYETATGKEVGSFNTHPDWVGCLAFSSDGQTLAVVGGSHEIRLWRIREDKKEWKEAGRLVGHEDDIWELAFSPDGKTIASASKDGTLRLWEVATGEERRRFAGHSGEVWCLAFAPDGRRLAAGGNDTAILVWDVTGRLQNGQLRPMKLSAHEVKSLWVDLTGADAVRAGQAIWTLAAASGQAIPLLREHLRPIAPISDKRIARLIADLNSETYAVRQKATDELEKLGEIAEPALRQALTKKPVSVEMRRRLEQLLEPLKKTFPLSGLSGDEVMRTLRALEVLGQTGTPEALTLLESLAQGEPRARQTREAQAVLKWLRARERNTTKP